MAGILATDGGDFSNLDLQTRVLGTLIAFGVLALLGWFCLRIGRRDILTLLKTPGRASSLGWLHITLILLWAALNFVSGYFSEHRPLRVEDIRGQAMMQFLILVVCLVCAMRNFDGGITRGLGLSTRRWLLDTIRGIVGFLAIFPVCLFLGFIGRKFIGEDNSHIHPLLMYLQESRSFVQLFWPFFVAIVMAPISEEVMYRGLMQTAIKNVTNSAWRSIVLSSMFFAAIHLGFSREPFGIVGVESFLPLFVLALAMGYNYQRTGRLWASIVIHSLFNTVNIIMTMTYSA